MISVVGYTGCGKTSIAKSLEHKGFRVLDVSSIIKTLNRDCVKLKNDATLLNEIKKSVKHMNTPIVVGVREQYINDYLRSIGYKIIKITCYENVRFDRVKKSRGYTVNDFVKKDLEERTIGLTKVMLSHGILIDGSESLSIVIKSVNEVLEE